MKALHQFNIHNYSLELWLQGLQYVHVIWNPGTMSFFINKKIYIKDPGMSYRSTSFFSLSS